MPLRRSSGLTCTLLHSETAACPMQLQPAPPQPDVSTPSGPGSAWPEVSTLSGSVPVSAGGSGESIQPSVASTPPPVSAGGSGESAQLPAAATLPPAQLPSASAPPPGSALSLPEVNTPAHLHPALPACPHPTT